MKRVALVLAGGEGSRLWPLTERRTKPAVPIAGMWRMIDPTLSNLVHSDIFTVGVMTQFLHRSLHRHIGTGKPWDLDGRNSRLELLPPVATVSGIEEYSGTANAVQQNINFINSNRAELVLIVSGDHVYQMDYRPMIEQHLRTGADVTIGAIRVKLEEASRFGILTINEENQVLSFVEKPTQTPHGHFLASMGIYLFEVEALKIRLEEDKNNEISTHDFGRDIIPLMLETDRVFAFEHRGFWTDLGTLEAYWGFHQNLIDNEGINFDDPYWTIWTLEEVRGPARYGSNSQVVNSLICNGCVIDGTVIRSVLSPGVVVSRGAIVKDSIVLHDATIGIQSRLNQAIIDKSVTVGNRAFVGYGDDYTENIGCGLQSGLTVIAKDVTIPPGMRIGKNCAVGSVNLGNSNIPSGSTLR